MSISTRFMRALTPLGIASTKAQVMRISGFTFVRNAVVLYYPVVESIRSILPICDEFVVAAGDSTDGTTELIRAIDSPKLRILETVWNPDQFVHGATNAVQTNIALDACRGDWAIYVQADEVVHQDDLPVLVESMQRHLHDRRVEGLLFDYLHFFADYDHYMNAHGWYRREVRVVRVPGWAGRGGGGGRGRARWGGRNERRNKSRLVLARGSGRSPLLFSRLHPPPPQSGTLS